MMDSWKEIRHFLKQKMVLYIQYIFQFFRRYWGFGVLGFWGFGVLVDVFDNDSRTRSIPLLQDRAAAWDKTSSQQRPQILGVNLL